MLYTIHNANTSCTYDHRIGQGKTVLIPTLGISEILNLSINHPPILSKPGFLSVAYISAQTKKSLEPEVLPWARLRNVYPRGSSS